MTRQHNSPREQWIEAEMAKAARQDAEFLSAITRSQRQEAVERQDAKGGSALPLLWFTAIVGLLVTALIIAITTGFDPLADKFSRLAVPQHFGCPTALC